MNNFLKNELSLNRKAGTYLFYGEDSQKNYEEAIEFSQQLLIKNLDNSLEIEKIKTQVARETYADLFVFENFVVDDARGLIKKSAASSYEGFAKIFIIKNIHNIRKEAANAILKVIEEPSKDNFFILLSNRLNILSTIKSRSIIYRVPKFSAEELEVDKYTYNFFSGSSVDIKIFKNSDINLSDEVSFKDILKFLKNFEKEKNIENKINIYKCLRNFVVESSKLKLYEKVKFAEDLYNNLSDKENIKLIVDYLINLVKKDKNLKYKLELKIMLRTNANLKLTFINLILNI